MPFSFNPIHYIALGSIIFNVVLVGYGFTVKTQLEASRGQFRAFKAESDAQASLQRIKNMKEIQNRDEITLKLENQNAKLKNDLDSKYTEYRRLLNSKAGSSDMPALSRIAERIDCPNSADRLTRSMERFEEGVIERLVRPRDEAVARTIMAKEWLEKQNDLTQ